jgi:hypothetical protein
MRGYQIGNARKKDIGQVHDHSIHLQNTQHHTLDLPFFLPLTNSEDLSARTTVTASATVEVDKMSSSQLLRIAAVIVAAP